MRLPELKSLCEALVPGGGEVEIHQSGQGLVNQTFRVTREQRDYALRIAIADGSAIALNRRWEAQILKIAGAAQLAPALLFSDAERGVLLCEWLAGRSWLGVDLSEAVRIERISALLRAVHGLPIPAPAQEMSPARWVAHYKTLGAAPGKHQPAAVERLNQLAALPATPRVLCHGDLHRLNLVQTGDSLRLLDWEYAHVSDALWDLAGWCANGDFTEDTQRRLLSSYLGSPPNAEEWRRLRLLAWLYDYICLQWSSIAAPLPAALAERAAFLDARLSLPAN
jgi:thiamine kinase